MSKNARWAERNLESGDAETFGLQRNSLLKRAFNEAQQGRGCAQQCLPGHFPAHQDSNLRKPILSHCASPGNLRPGFASWKGTLQSESAKSSSRNSQQCLKCRGSATLWMDAPCARQEQSPSQLPLQPSPAPAVLQGTTPWDLLPERFRVSRVS